MLTNITSRVWYRPHEEETDRPLLGYILGDEKAMLVDGGNSPAHLTSMLKSIEKQGLPKPCYVALTHFHWDHTFGLGGEAGAKLIAFATNETNRRLNQMAQWEWTEQAMLKRLKTKEDIPFCHEYMQKEYSDVSQIFVRPAQVTYDSRVTIQLGNCPIHLIPLNNSHSPDCQVVYLPKEKVVFLGDIHYEDLAHEPPCYYLPLLQALIKALKDLDFEYAMPGHQSPMTKAALLNDLEQAEAQQNAHK